MRRDPSDPAEQYSTVPFFDCISTDRSLETLDRVSRKSSEGVTPCELSGDLECAIEIMSHHGHRGKYPEVNSALDSLLQPLENITGTEWNTLEATKEPGRNISDAQKIVDCDRPCNSE